MAYPERFRTTVFQLPKRMLNMRDSDIKMVTATAIRPEGGVAAVLAPMLRLLTAGAHTYGAAVGEKLAGNVTDLLATLVADARMPMPNEVPASMDDVIRRDNLGRADVTGRGTGTRVRGCPPRGRRAAPWRRMFPRRSAGSRAPSSSR